MGDGSRPGAPPLRGASGDTFASLLDRLKRRGTSVLVVGDLSGDVERALSRRMMGSPDEQRYRLLATLRPQRSPDRWFPDPVSVDDEWVEVADHGGLARDAVAAGSYDGGVGGPQPNTDQLVDRVEEWVAEVQASNDPGPGAIRVGITSLDVLLERSDSPAPQRVAERVHDVMRDYQGVAHLYLPRARSSRVVQRTAVWVDVVVEVRTNRGRPEQRWSVQDTVETSWFPIRDDEPHDPADD